MSLTPHRSLAAAALALLTALLLAGCSQTSGSFPSETAPMTSVDLSDGYLLEQGNRIRLTVYNEDKLSGDYTVDSGGNIALPLIGNVPAGGVTAKVLAARVAEVLKREGYMQDPNVAVEVQTFRPFYVLGEVREPGEFPYTAGMTVLSAIARARGYDYRAYQGDVVLVRQLGNQQREYRATERTPILPGDIIKVLERRF